MAATTTCDPGAVDVDGARGAPDDDRARRSRRVHHARRGRARALRGRPACSRAEQHPDADRLTVCTVDVGDGDEPHQIVCGAPNVAAGPDRRGRAAGRGDARRHEAQEGQAARRRVRRDDPRRGRGRASATDHDGIMVLDDELAPGTPLADVLPIGDRRARARDHAEPARLPERLRRRARGPRRHRRAARARRRGPTTPAPPGEVAGRRDRGRGPRPVPALHRAAVRGRRRSARRRSG